jgi:glycosyltransferase involved in cell wall biosynthesis
MIGEVNRLEFSVLISIYYKENAKHFNRAMRSIWDDQTVKPGEIILVEDGPLTDKLYEVISEWKDRLGTVLNVVSLESNVGIGCAKNIGVEKCTKELIAVMDSDDISLSHRFEMQLQVFESKNVDVCGAWIGEFYHNENKIVSYRRVPEKQVDIIKFSKTRSPVNHAVCMYRKTAVLSIGNYSKDYRFGEEDYDLWARMILNGAVFYNIQEALLSMRMGNGQLEERRGGLDNAVREVVVQKEFYKMGFLNLFQFIRNVIIGFIARILPKALLKIVFKVIRKY